MSPHLFRRHAVDLPPRPLSDQELQISRGLESLRDATVREVMTPRADVVALEDPVTLADVSAALRRSGRSHYPVYRDDLDHLVGVLYVKDLLASFGAVEGSATANLTERAREPYIVPESQSALEVLADMRRGRRGFAVVVDEYGGLAGVLTINDLVSDLVGDLHDEYDRSSQPPIVRIDAKRHLVEGSCPVDDVRDQLGCPIPDGEYVTLGGFLLDALGRIPEEGTLLEQDGWIYRITEMDSRRIALVVVEDESAIVRDGPDNNLDRGK